MTYCKNKGHESHCGNPLRKMIDKSQPHAVGLTEIEVCDHRYINDTLNFAIMTKVWDWE